VPVVLRRTAALTALALALVPAACSSGGGGEDDARAARVGETFVATLWSEIEGHPSTIVVPGLRYDLLVTSPRERADSVSTRDTGVSVDAAEGTRFVGVTWDLAATAGGDALVLAGHGPDGERATLALVVDGETIDLGPLDAEAAKGWWVVVPEDADTIGVAVTYDGVTQTIEDATDRLAVPEGGSELLYAVDTPRVHQPSCSEPAQGPEPERYVIGSCNVSISDPIPYHRQLGWADEGSAWVVVRLRMREVVVGWDDGTDAYAGYTTTSDEVEVRLDGAESFDLLPSEPERTAGLQDEGTWTGDVIFRVPVGTDPEEVVIVRPYAGVPEDPAAAAAIGFPAELAGAYEVTLPID
jgi:hypothetical protein